MPRGVCSPAHVHSAGLGRVCACMEGWGVRARSGLELCARGVSARMRVAGAAVYTYRETCA